MNMRNNSIEKYLFGIAIVLAFIIRFINLGVTPLNDYEASWALQALRIIQGSHQSFGPQPAYLQLTGLFFNLFGSSNFLARFWPAIIGSLIVFVPFILRKQIGNIPAIILAFVLSLDPGILAISHQAGSPVVGIVSAWLALAFWTNKKPEIAGIFLGLALMGGESFWVGVIGLAIAIGLMRLVDIQALKELFGIFIKHNDQVQVVTLEPEESTSNLSRILSISIIKLVCYVIGTIFLLGTMFFTRPIGISGLAGGLTAYLSGWIKPGGTSPALLLLALAAYQPLAVIFGVAGAVRSWISKDPLDRFLSIWTGLILVLGLLYPAREINNLVWLVIPLWVLAVREIMRHMSLPRKEIVSSLSYVLLTFVVAGFIWLNLEQLANYLAIGSDTASIFALIGAVIVLLFFTSLLISWGWSAQIVKRGLLWGFSLFLIVYSISGVIGVSDLKAQYTSELWTQGASLPQANLLIKTINELSDTHNMAINNLDVVVISIKSPGLEWALRRFPSPLFTDNLAVGSTPSIIITPKENNPVLAATYRGNGFVLTQTPVWSSMYPSQFIEWLAYHTAPQSTQSIILWARADLFPAGGVTTSTNP
jgi:hypothetical protein